MHVQPSLPEFAATRDVVAQVRATTQAAAAEYLCSLTATQFERLATAAQAEVADDVRRLLVRVALAETLAEQALAHVMPDVVADLAADVAALASEAREEITNLVSTAAEGTDAPNEHDAPAAAADQIDAGQIDADAIDPDAIDDVH